MKKIPLTKGYFAIVDDDDYEKVSAYKWSARPSGSHSTLYACRGGGKRKATPIKMERLIINVPDEFIPDHINGNGLDNRKANLRLATYQQNAFNRHKTLKQTSSKYKGVTKNWKSPKKWQASIYADGKTLFLGSFPCQVCAALAYDLAAIDKNGEFAATNFIQP